LPYNLAGVEVFVNDALAPVLAVVIPAQPTSQLEQINFQVPIERNVTDFFTQYGKTETATIYVVVPPGYVSPPFVVPVAAPGGGFFGDSKGYPIAQHASDYSPVTIQNPAHAGEAIIAYADDFFRVWPPPPIGIPVPPQPLFNFIPRSEYPGGPGLAGSKLYLQQYPQPNGRGFLLPNTPPLQILFQGLAPGMVGVEQVNFVVPQDQVAGDWALFFSNADATRGGPTGVSVLLPVR
jgi:hypothetical protein